MLNLLTKFCPLPLAKTALRLMRVGAWLFVANVLGPGFGPAWGQNSALTPLIGKTLMIGWPGTQVSDPSTQTLCRQLSRWEVGGVLFLRHNMISVDQVIGLTSFFSRCGARRGLLLALDQEGGLVDRLGRLPGEASWPSAAEVSRLPIGTVEEIYTDMALRVHQLGFNINFGPVVDLNINPASPVIGALGRSFGAEPQQVGTLAEAFINAHQSYRVATSLKHFPGHGSALNDSHLGFTDISQTWENQELQPFLDLGAAAGALMVGHLVHQQFDTDGLPASLSHTMLSGFLRTGLGYDGAVISDDMAMAAISDQYGLEESIHLSLRAGIDLFVHSNSGPYRSDFVDTYHRTVRAALRQQTISEADLQAKAQRLEQWVR